MKYNYLIFLIVFISEVGYARRGNFSVKFPTVFHKEKYSSKLSQEEKSRIDLHTKGLSGNFKLLIRSDFCSRFKSQKLFKKILSYNRAMSIVRYFDYKFSKPISYKILKTRVFPSRSLNNSCLTRVEIVSDNESKIKYKEFKFVKDKIEINFSRSNFLITNKHLNILKKNIVFGRGKFKIKIDSYSSNLGSFDLNYELSKARSYSLYNFFRSNNIDPKNILIRWHGEEKNQRKSVIKIFSKKIDEKEDVEEKKLVKKEKKSKIEKKFLEEEDDDEKIEPEVSLEDKKRSNLFLGAGASYFIVSQDRDYASGPSLYFQGKYQMYPWLNLTATTSLGFSEKELNKDNKNQINKTTLMSFLLGADFRYNISKIFSIKFLKLESGFYRHSSDLLTDNAYGAAVGFGVDLVLNDFLSLDFIFKHHLVYLKFDGVNNYNEVAGVLSYNF